MNSEGKERMPALTTESKILHHLNLPAPSYASRTASLRAPRKPRGLCQPYQSRSRWHKVCCKRIVSRRPNQCPSCRTPHCQHAGVVCARVLWCRIRAKDTEVPASLPASNTLSLPVQDAPLHGCVGRAATAKGPKANQHSRPEVEGGQAIQVISPSTRIGGEQHEGASQRATLA